MHATERNGKTLHPAAGEGIQAARAGGLRYVSDRQPGFRRRRAGKGFIFLDTRGRVIRDAETVFRLRRLAIPPAWTDVWICPSPGGHLQATGKDARGRKQYRYHSAWRETRDATKYAEMAEFARALPRIRRRVRQDLRLRGFPRRKVLATVVRLLECTLIRIGNEEYAESNGSYGLTTFRDHHVKVRGPRLLFRFRAKTGKQLEVSISDPLLAKLVKRCQDLPGQELFQYVDDHGRRRDVDSSDVNEYLREASGRDFTAKDFRTWAGTVVVSAALKGMPGFKSQRHAKRNLCQAIAEAAGRLGNTSTICRKSYVHPVVVDAYLSGSFTKIPSAPKPVRGLVAAESLALSLLETRR